MTKTVDEIMALAQQHGIQYRLTPEGTTEMWCWAHNVQAFAKAIRTEATEQASAKQNDSWLLMTISCR